MPAKINAKFAQSDAYLSELMRDVRAAPVDGALPMGRRTFVKLAGAGAAGLVLGFRLPSEAFAAANTPQGRNDQAINAFIRIAPDGAAKQLYKTPEAYVWCLALNSKGDKLYAGTGPKGRIYQVTPEGKGSVFYTTKQEHILCMATGPNDDLFAGTDKGGLVYRIDPRGKGFVLYAAPQ